MMVYNSPTLDGTFETTVAFLDAWLARQRTDEMSDLLYEVESAAEGLHDLAPKSKRDEADEHMGIVRAGADQLQTLIESGAA
ncbi:hypothetical protein GCM10023340_38730 [Nocardioides marinquilinus]|uniref:Uncharacterized protein n=1 Tax=Nocardioides marinquilinus TaxID=1210400 RepID=A0ABP9Q4P6_9ACTN